MFIPTSLYDEIKKSMPIPCVDLLVKNTDAQILLLKRKHEPAAGQWWFPGGRVHFNETRESAALRKLREECGLAAHQSIEIGTYDVFLEFPSSNSVSHGITTVFVTLVKNAPAVVIDDTSLSAEWKTIDEWKKEKLHPFVLKILGL